MTIMFKYYPLVLMFSLALLACSKKDEERNEGIPTGALVVKGNLANGEDAANNDIVAGRMVYMKTSTGSVVGSSETDSEGNFKMPLAPGALAVVSTTTTALSLTETAGVSADNQFIIESTVEDDGDGKALGIRKAIRITNESISGTEGSASVVDIGTNSLREIGAISGSVTFASGLNPEGTDVFIPGKSFFARTAKDGKFHLLYVPAGTHTVRIENGVYFKELEVEVEQNKTEVLGVTQVSKTDRNPKPLEEVILGKWTTKCWSNSVEPSQQGTIDIIAFDNIVTTGSQCVFAFPTVLKMTVISDSAIIAEERMASGTLSPELLKVTSYTQDVINFDVGTKIEVFTRLAE